MDIDDRAPHHVAGEMSWDEVHGGCQVISGLVALIWVVICVLQHVGRSDTCPAFEDSETQVQLKTDRRIKQKAAKLLGCRRTAGGKHTWSSEISGFSAFVIKCDLSVILVKGINKYNEPKVERFFVALLENNPQSSC